MVARPQGRADGNEIGDQLEGEILESGDYLPTRC
jgi:hypothetical protein